MTDLTFRSSKTEMRESPIHGKGLLAQIVFVAMRDIAPGEELTHDWATTDDLDYEMDCECGRQNCRRIVTGRDWMKKELQERTRAESRRSAQR